MDWINNQPLFRIGQQINTKKRLNIGWSMYVLISMQSYVLCPFIIFGLWWQHKTLQNELLELVLHTHYPQLYKTKQNGDWLQQFYCHRVAACSSPIMTNLPKAFQMDSDYSALLIYKALPLEDSPFDSFADLEPHRHYVGTPQNWRRLFLDKMGKFFRSDLLNIKFLT